jgi:hypothetical protein
MEDLYLLSLNYVQPDRGLKTVLHMKDSVILLLMVALTDKESESNEEEFTFSNYPGAANLSDCCDSFDRRRWNCADTGG